MLSKLWLAGGAILLLAFFSCNRPEDKQSTKPEKENGEALVIEQKLAGFAPVRVDYNPSALGLNDREQQVISKLIEASQYIESIYSTSWRAAAIRRTRRF